MRWNDLKTVVAESGERVIIAVTFSSGKKITIRNVPKSLTTMPNFDAKVQAAAKKAKPQEIYKSWGVVGDAEADKIDSTSTTTSTDNGKPDTFQASDEEKEAMQNVLNLHRLIMNTMEKSVWKGLKNNTNDNIDKGLYYLPRQNDPVFPTGVSFEYTIGGKKFKINDIKEEIGIDLVVNTNNPKKDKYGYLHAEGWPVYMNEWDDMKQITIDAVNAREHISTVGPPAPEQKVDGPLRIAISPKTFYYRNATVVDTDNN
jgi:hypothetical protein|tara:strand:+ start:3025 stop:3798 length:774 start_codon:yes stop_codon:yes gene_type:complete